MEIHQIERDTTLQISVYPTERYFAANVREAEIRKVGLGDGLIDRLVLSDSAQEIAFGFFTREAGIIRITAADFQSHISSNDCGVVAQ